MNKVCHLYYQHNVSDVQEFKEIFSRLLQRILYNIMRERTIKWRGYCGLDWNNVC